MNNLALSKNSSPRDYIDGILKGDVTLLSRAITLVESQQDAHQKLAQQIIDGIIFKTGNSFRLGVTGVPGVGKSTFIESFGKEVVSQGHKLAVLAIDPSSTKSKGSILGDKTRMEELSVLPQVYIRPSPSSGTLGGVTRVTYETILLCEAAGYDYVVVETVGVGQSEIAVSRITDFFLLLMLAGAGDELQGIKRGIMEMADALLITKADGDNADKARAARSEYAHAMHLLQAPESGWTARTLVCSGLQNTGIREAYNTIEEFRLFVKANGYFTQKRKDQQYELFLNAVDEQLKARFYHDEDVQKKLLEIKQKGSIQPFQMARELLDRKLR
ncbi:MAG: methylmalonyl Co-A mutase-associated GTPase MeaB [bacterium]|nr:methylmalonyl Co-A mutase-associated GTPase MeaB [bacterium]